MKRLIIISGYSKGIGRQLAEEYARQLGTECGIIGISRTEPDELKRLLNREAGWFRSMRADLAEHQRLRSLLDQLDDLCDRHDEERGKPESVVLINNAALLDPLKTLGRLWRDDGHITEASHALTANCLAPALLAGWFIERFATLESDHKIILNMSSGASQGPMPGAGIYSMSKAAINMLSMSIAAEQKHAPNPVKAVSLSPGMVETNMQEMIRSKNADDFPEVDFFRSAAEEGKVRSPEDIARAIISMNLTTLESGGYYHLRDFI
jgi:benzil reductase ((S)-benzoin forming)